MKHLKHFYLIVLVLLVIASSAVTTTINQKKFSVERASLEEELRIAKLSTEKASEKKDSDDFSPYIDLVYLPSVEKNSKNTLETSNFDISKISSKLPDISLNCDISRIELLEGKFNDEEVDQTILRVYLDESSEDFRVTFLQGDSFIGNLQESALFADNLELSFRGYLGEHNESLTINGLPENLSTFTIKTREATPGYTLEVDENLHTVETIQFIFPCN